MPPESASPRGRARRLFGRDAECGELDSFLEALRRGESRSLAISGEAGVGKTALLEYLAGRAADGRVIGVTAVQSEVELAFAALHQLCAPILDELEGLPAPQREALRITFGLHEGPVPNRFLVGMAVLSVLAEAAADRPLVCVVDDARQLGRCFAWWMTRSGWTGPRPRSWPSWRAGWAWSRWGLSLRPGSRPRS